MHGLSSFYTRAVRRWWMLITGEGGPADEDFAGTASIAGKDAPSATRVLLELRGVRSVRPIRVFVPQAPERSGAVRPPTEPEEISTLTQLTASVAGGSTIGVGLDSDASRGVHRLWCREQGMPRRGSGRFSRCLGACPR